jgi:hypothetical protein
VKKPQAAAAAARQGQKIREKGVSYQSKVPLFPPPRPVAHEKFNHDGANGEDEEKKGGGRWIEISLPLPPYSPLAPSWLKFLNVKF